MANYLIKCIFKIITLALRSLILILFLYIKNKVRLSIIYYYKYIKYFYYDKSKLTL